MSLVSPSVFIVATWLAAICGGIGIAAAFVSAIVGYQLTEGAFRESSVKIAEANAQAQKAELARAKLEAQLKPRWDISKAQMAALIAALSENKDKIGPIFLCKFMDRDDKEASWFAATIAHAMTAAGIDFVTKEFSSDQISGDTVTLDGLVSSRYGYFVLFNSGGTTSAGLYDAFSKVGLIESFAGSQPLDKKFPRPYLFVLSKPPPFSQKTPDWAAPELRSSPVVPERKKL